VSVEFLVSAAGWLARAARWPGCPGRQSLAV